MAIIELPYDAEGKPAVEKLCLVKRADSLPESVIRRICAGSPFWTATPCFMPGANTHAL